MTFDRSLSRGRDRPCGQSGSREDHAHAWLGSRREIAEVVAAKVRRAPTWGRSGRPGGSVALGTQSDPEALAGAPW